MGYGPGYLHRGDYIKAYGDYEATVTVNKYHLGTYYR